MLVAGPPHAVDIDGHSGDEVVEERIGEVL